MFYVRVFLETSMKGPRKGDGWYGYLLETTSKGEARTISEVAMEHDVTANQLHMKALLAALGRLNQECEVEIYTESTYLRSNYENNLDDWAAGGWMTARGEPVKNRELWEKIYRIGKWEQRIRFSGTYKHEYKSWLCAEIARRKQEAERPGRRMHV